MICYKLFRKMKDGSLKSLFINKKVALPIDTWMDAEEYKTKGFAVRKGWHCCVEKNAPHLTEKGRIWKQVEVSDYVVMNRPSNQGQWVLANRMRILE